MWPAVTLNFGRSCRYAIMHITPNQQILKIVISQPDQTGSLRYWQGKCSPRSGTLWIVQNGWKLNPRWTTAAIMEIHKQVYLNHFWTHFHQISSAARRLLYACHLYPKIRCCQNSIWQQGPSWIWIFGPILLTSVVIMSFTSMHLYIFEDVEMS